MVLLDENAETWMARFDRRLPVGLSCLLVRLLVLRAPFRRSLAQAGQDRWVIDETFLRKRGGFFLEVGSADGVFINNTYLLEKRYEWSGICIEPNPQLFRKLVLNRGCTCFNVCIDEQAGEAGFALRGLVGGIIAEETDNPCPGVPGDGWVARVPTVPLAEVLRASAAPPTIDYCSIDVEGAETRVLRSFDFRSYRFLSLTVERPSDELHAILTSNGYVLVRVIPGLDSFYVHDSFQREYARNVLASHGWTKPLAPAAPKAGSGETAGRGETARNGMPRA
jgi:FkbM family methyltransferase